MTTAEMIIAVAVFAIAGILALLSIRSFLRKGFLLNNAYIYASEEEREAMDKKPYYRQTGVVFCLLSIVFIIVGISVVLQNYKIELLQIPVIAGTVIYAIVSSIRIGKNNKKQ